MRGFIVTTSEPQVRYKVIKSLAFSALVLAIGGAASYGLSQLRKPPELRDPEKRLYKIDVFAVEAANVREIINAFGTARPSKEVVLSAQIPGEVKETHPQLKVGLSVKSYRETAANDPSGDGERDRYAGDLLVRIDPSTYEERVAAARHRLDEDRSELKRITQEETNLDRVYQKIVADWEDSQREYQKALKLREQGINTDSDIRRATMELRQHEKNKLASNNERDLLPLRREQTERRIETHTTDLKLSELDLARTFIRPPFDGVLSAVHVERGQYVKVGDPLLTITADAEVEIPLSVTLDDYAKLLPLVRDDQFPVVELAENETDKHRWTGHVVRFSPKVDEQTRTATVFIRVDNTTHKPPLLPGTFVHARVEGPILKQIIAVPRDAIPEGRAFVERNGKVEEHRVVVSRTLGGLALIESGLEAGDLIALTNLDVLMNPNSGEQTQDGDPVSKGVNVSVNTRRTLAEELSRQRTCVARLIPPDETK